MKKWLCMFFALTAALSLCACRKPADNADAVTYGVVMMEENEFTAQLLEGIREITDKSGIVLTVEYAATVDEQNRALEALIAQPVDGIIVQPAQPDELDQMMRRAEASNIPTVSIGSFTKNCRYYVNYADLNLFAQTLLDAALASVGTGEFAILAHNRFSGMNALASAVEQCAANEPYLDLTLVKTVYEDPDKVSVEDNVSALLAEYPDLKLIICPDGSLLPQCCQALRALQSDVKAIGLGPADRVQDYLGADKECVCTVFWDALEAGRCAAHTLQALRDGAVITPGRELVISETTRYAVVTTEEVYVTILPGRPIRYTQ